MNPKLLRAIVPLLSLSLIGYGCWVVYPALGFIIVGALLWVDLLIGSLRKTA